ncbi:halocyanin domain-containing protein [Halobacterium jilantaiense]|uniref:halocyanin domain-containing protein n=1 Tax=Halobacterium jilantaiense TaxID=355548 RepID=UPI001FE1CED1|nr:halocyanin domain-containing protein [Halobacterium jilantaiense]
MGTSALAGGAAAQDAGVAEWLSGVSNYDGVVDETGSDSVTVEVGVEANGGPYGFGPAAVRVDPGTEVTFEWVSNTHNVVVESQPENADWSGEEEINNEGYTYSATFETEGVYQYFCGPHRSMGMKGAVVVGDVEVGGGSGGGGIDWAEVGVLGFAGILGLGLLSPLVSRALGESERGRRHR